MKLQKVNAERQEHAQKKQAKLYQEKTNLINFIETEKVQNDQKNLEEIQ
jgi:hypothetical protein